MAFRADLEALTAKLRLAEAERDTLRERLAELEDEESDSEAKDDRLRELEGRVEKLRPFVDRVEALRVANAGLRQRVRELESEAKQSAKLLAERSPGLPSSSAGLNPLATIVLILMFLGIVATCAANAVP